MQSRVSSLAPRGWSGGWFSTAGSVLLLSCASTAGAPDAAPAAPADAAVAPLIAATSDSGKLAIEVRTTPDQPPTRGVSTVALDITDAETGEPVDGLTLEIVPWMPAMGHGTSVKPAVEAKGNGSYVVTRVNMFMGGKWDLRTSISGAVADDATLHFSIR